MKTFDLENLPFDPAVEAMKESTLAQSTPSEKTSDLIEQVMKRHQLTRQEALEMLETFGY
ncbi:hypothetical protein [Limnohabitans sp. Rim8]|uniref:hypothetical protein n=1 Tax=Limnohabitans sp. Rim8 TaxID=1100718 RepID=UPI002632482B|nr:hypothetical protein [Limnohabitans sp. Rim8]